MIRNLLFILAALAILAPSAEAQSWRKLKKEAEAAYERGEWLTAAQTYDEAFRKKRKKEDLTFQAGEIYFTLRDYRNAAEAYRPIKDKNDEFPLVGLKYARCLKQDGQYDRAIQEFETFMQGYTGDTREILEEIIRVEIAGCRLGMEAPARANRDLEMLLPGEGINSDKQEFAPFPITDDELYFSSTVNGSAKILVSKRDGNQWGKGETPRNFPLIQNGHFCNAAMAPDGNRIYFTVCNDEEPVWNDVKTRCEIFVTKRVGAQWSQPERLPDYINTAGVVATHPFVVHQRGQEMLYFSSNREGGRGGMDIWFASRDLGLDDNDFSFPINLGPVVNTLGDEITPFYNREDQVLYFSSNGHVSIGGFDVFKANGDEVSWSQPENMGMPVNSSADDYFFALNPSRKGGFLTSNRVFAGNKIVTTNEDIFEFAKGGRRMIVKGNVYDRGSGNPIGAITVRLYEVMNDGREAELRAERFSDGRYSFDILPNRQFRVEVEAYGYQTEGYAFSSDNPEVFAYGQPTFLQQEGAPAAVPDPPAEPEVPGRNLPVEPTEPTAPVISQPTVPANPPAPNTPYVTTSRDPNDNNEYQTSATRHSGTYYKVQLAAVGAFSPERFSNVADLGEVQTELILARSLNRVMLADFFTLEDARRVLATVKSRGYEGAYLIEYIDGDRYGRVR